MASVLGPAVGAHCAAHSKRCLAWAGRLAGAQLPRYQADFPRQAAAASPVSPCRITHCPMHAMRQTGGAALAAQRLPRSACRAALAAQRLRRTQPGWCSSIRAGTTSRSSSARRCSTTARACRRRLLWPCMLGAAGRRQSVDANSLSVRRSLAQLLAAHAFVAAQVCAVGSEL